MDYSKMKEAQLIEEIEALQEKVAELGQSEVWLESCRFLEVRNNQLMRDKDKTKE